MARHPVGGAPLRSGGLLRVGRLVRAGLARGGFGLILDDASTLGVDLGLHGLLGRGLDDVDD